MRSEDPKRVKPFDGPCPTCGFYAAEPVIRMEDYLWIVEHYEKQLAIYEMDQKDDGEEEDDLCSPR